jgi:hypothetical protein
MRLRVVSLAAFLVSSVFSIAFVHGHGVLGKRFFPSMITLEDPFPSDEMDLLTVERESKNKDETETSLGMEFSKRLTPDLSIGVDWEYIFIEQSGGGTRSGFENPEFNLKYALFRSIDHESIVSFGFAVKPGGVGSKRVAEKVTTLRPALLFGKGFGDLPDSLDYLKPIAITGALEVENPANRRTGSGDHKEHHSTTVQYGLALMYSMLYLQSYVRDVNLRAPFDRLFPVLEFNFETNTSRHDKGQTTGFASPGLLWAGKYFQVGLQAQVPMNNASGKNAGVKGSMLLFIDNIAPNIFTWTPWGVIGPSQK